MLRKKFRSEFNISEDVVVVAIVGRLVKIKQHRLFIEIAEKLLKQKHSKKRYCFFIVGDGDEYEQLKTLSVMMGLRVLQKNKQADREFDIAFTSWRKDIDCVMAGIDILLMTSLNEGTPVAILEAMAAGKPIVSTPVGGIPELIAAADCGFVSSEKSEMIKQIEFLASADKIRIEKGMLGRQFVTTNLTIQRQAEELSLLYAKEMHQAS